MFLDGHGGRKRGDSESIERERNTLLTLPASGAVLSGLYVVSVSLPASLVVFVFRLNRLPHVVLNPLSS